MQETIDTIITNDNETLGFDGGQLVHVDTGGFRRLVNLKESLAVYRRLRTADGCTSGDPLAINRYLQMVERPGPTLHYVWAWTWRVLFCLVLAAILASIPFGILYSIALAR